MASMQMFKISLLHTVISMLNNLNRDNFKALHSVLADKQQRHGQLLPRAAYSKYLHVQRNVGLFPHCAEGFA